MILTQWILFWIACTVNVHARPSVINGPYETHRISKRDFNIRSCNTPEQRRVINSELKDVPLMLQVAANRLDMLLRYLRSDLFGVPPVKMKNWKWRSSYKGEIPFAPEELDLLSSAYATYESLIQNPMPKRGDVKRRKFADTVLRVNFTKNVMLDVARNLTAHPFSFWADDGTRTAGGPYEPAPGESLHAGDLEYWCDDRWLVPVPGAIGYYSDERPTSHARGRVIFLEGGRPFHLDDGDMAHARPMGYAMNDLSPPALLMDPTLFQIWGSENRPYASLGSLRDKGKQDAFDEVKARGSKLAYLAHYSFATDIIFMLPKLEMILSTNPMENFECDPPPPEEMKPGEQFSTYKCLLELAKRPDDAMYNTKAFKYLVVAMFLDFADWSSGEARPLHWIAGKIRVVYEGGPNQSGGRSSSKAGPSSSEAGSSSNPQVSF